MPESGGQVGLAGAGRAEQHDVAGLGQEPAGCQGGDLLTDGGLGVPVELLDGLACGEPGGADPQLGAGCVAGGDLAVEDRGEVLLVGPARVAGVVGQPGGCFGDPWRLQRRREIGDLLERLGRVALRLAVAIRSTSSAVDEPEGAVVVGQIPHQPIVRIGGRAGSLELLAQHASRSHVGGVGDRHARAPRPGRGRRPGALRGGPRPGPGRRSRRRTGRSPRGRRSSRCCRRGRSSHVPAGPG